jgi:phenylacetate-CoA ligase
MGIDFKARDFAHPLALWKTNREFDRNQERSAEALAALQWRAFTRMAAHAYDRVPFYRRAFDERGLRPSDLVSPADLAKLPFLTKAVLSRSFQDLTATDARRHGARPLQTSGTTGGRVRFLVDRSANILEFVYYWRFWGWHGYRLGDRFAEFSAESFLPIDAHRDRLVKASRLTNRILLNGLVLSRGNVRDYVAIVKRLRPKFLKGLPSSLYVFALLCRDVGETGIRFRAVFSQGEHLPDGQRRLIEEVFSTRVYDSYGHLERTVAISQCPQGRYHVHPDYGLTEFVTPEQPPELAVDLSPSESVFEIVSSGLHNLAMPLLRYRTGDLAVIDAGQKACPCGLSFPLVRAVIGRQTDVVVTPDKRAVTALYVALDRVAGIARAQIVQESLDTLIVHLVRGAGAPPDLEQQVVRMIQSFTGTAMRVVVRDCDLADLQDGGGRKFRSLVSRVDPLALLS